MAFVEYELENRIAVIRLNRPERLNALSRELVEELIAAFQEFNGDDAAWVGILAGAGRAFCAGRDLKAQAAGLAVLGTARYSSERNLFGIVDTDKPLIAAVQGYAMGAGWYMTCGCDIRIAAEDAVFGMTELPTGVLGPYWLAGAETVPWAIGAEIALLGEHIGARRLLQLGMLNEVVPLESLMPAARRWAEKFLRLPPTHVRRTKRLMQRVRALPAAEVIAEEREVRQELNALSDTLEAAKAFAEKRAPHFTGW